MLGRIHMLQRSNILFMYQFYTMIEFNIEFVIIIMYQNNEKIDKFNWKVAFLMYKKAASKLKSHRGLGTRLT